jgi:hypothetical protein
VTVKIRIKIQCKKLRPGSSCCYRWARRCVGWSPVALIKTPHHARRSAISFVGILMILSSSVGALRIWVVSESFGEIESEPK